MKKIFYCMVALSCLSSYSQTNEEKVVALSQQLFTWEVENNIDALENTFDDQFVVVSGDGSSKNKQQYISLLRSGTFVHNRINISSSVATVANNTATVVGKGTFSVTVSGAPITLVLSYIEVFTRVDSAQPWKVLAMHATVLPN